jgi:hypothetical protein
MPSSPRSRLMVMVVAALISGATSGGYATQAVGYAATDPPSRKVINAAAAMQVPLVAMAARIHQLVDSLELDGYAGTEFDIPAQTITLRWRGPVPAQIIDMLAVIPAGTHVVVRAARFSIKDLDREERRLVSASVQEVGARILAVAPTPDFSGLDVTVDVGGSGVIPAINSAIPTHVAQGHPDVPEGSRQSDTPAFWGGATIQDSVYICSTGFTAYMPASGTRVMLTDRHCDPNAIWHTGDGANTVGTSSAGVASIDAMYISGSSYDPWIYRGSYTSASGAVVDAALRVSLNQIVCFGGSRSGEVCNNKVTAVNAFRGGVGPGFITIQLNGQGAAGGGDSGGPVFGDDGFGGVVAYGLIDAGIVGQEAPCTGITNRTCWYGQFSTNIGDVLSTQNLALVQARGRFTNAYSSRCLDADTLTINGNGTKVQLWDCSGGSNQSWYFPGDGTIRNGWSGRCLDADSSGGGGNGSRIQLWDCLGNGNQAWTMLGDGTIRNWQYGRCLDASMQSIGGNGTAMQLWDCLGTANQRWHMS